MLGQIYLTGQIPRLIRNLVDFNLIQFAKRLDLSSEVLRYDKYLSMKKKLNSLPISQFYETKKYIIQRKTKTLKQANKKSRLDMLIAKLDLADVKLLK